MSSEFFFGLFEKQTDMKPTCFSNRPNRTYLSKHLIALLSFGGVPNEFFMDVLKSNLEDADHVYSNKRAALRGVSLTHFYLLIPLLVVFHQKLLFI